MNQVGTTSTCGATYYVYVLVHVDYFSMHAYIRYVGRYVGSNSKIGKKNSKGDTFTTYLPTVSVCCSIKLTGFRLCKTVILLLKEKNIPRFLMDSGRSLSSSNFSLFTCLLYVLV